MNKEIIYNIHCEELGNLVKLNGNKTYFSKDTKTFKTETFESVEEAQDIRDKISKIYLDKKFDIIKITITYENLDKKKNKKIKKEGK